MDELYSSDQIHVLRRGRVPARRQNNIPRKLLLNKIYTNVRKLIDVNDRWLVVHGPVGCGKTQLVVDMLWERPELSLVDFKRIFWLTDRASNDDEFELTRDSSAELVRDALVLLSVPSDDESNFFASRRREARQFFGGKLYERLIEFRPTDRILFVLNGVLSSDTIRLFDEFTPPNCRFIATSTNCEAFAALNTMTHFVRVPSDASDLEADVWNRRSVLSAVDVSELVSAAGRNFALLEKVFRLSDNDPKMVPSLLYRLRFCPLKELRCITAYRNANLEDSLRACFQLLDERICSAFETFVVFEARRPIPFRVLKDLWPMDLCGQETNDEINGMLAQDLRSLICNSLLDTEYEKEEDFQKLENSEEMLEGRIKYEVSIVEKSNKLEPSTTRRPQDEVDSRNYNGLNYDNERSSNMDHIYFVQPIVLSFLVHRTGNYETFRRNVKRVLDEPRHNSSALSHFVSANLERLYNLYEWAERLVVAKSKQKKVSRNCGQSMERQMVALGPDRTLQTLQQIIFLPFGLLRNIFNFIFRFT